MPRVDEYLQQMTLEEKISMLAGADLWHTFPGTPPRYPPR